MNVNAAEPIKLTNTISKSEAKLKKKKQFSVWYCSGEKLIYINLHSSMSRRIELDYIAVLSFKMQH